MRRMTTALHDAIIELPAADQDAIMRVLADLTKIPESPERVVDVQGDHFSNESG